MKKKSYKNCNYSLIIYGVQFLLNSFGIEVSLIQFHFIKIRFKFLTNKTSLKWLLKSEKK